MPISHRNGPAGAGPPEELRAKTRRPHDIFLITVVHVIHDRPEAMVTSDRIVVMNHGWFEQTDDPDTAYGVPYIQCIEDPVRRRFIRRTSCSIARWTTGRPCSRDSTCPPPWHYNEAASREKASFTIRPQAAPIERKVSAPMIRCDVSWVRSRSAPISVNTGNTWVRPWNSDARSGLRKDHSRSMK